MGTNTGESSGKSDYAAMAALLGAMLMWSSAFIFTRVALREFHPFLLLFSRLGLGLVLLLPLCLGRLPRPRYESGDWRFLALLVLVEPCLFFLFEGFALRYTTASQAGAITAVLPLITAVMARFFLGEKLRGLVWAGFFLALGGVGLLSLSGQDAVDAPNAMLGNSLELCAMVMAGLYTICVRRLMRYSALFLVLLQTAGGAVFFGLLCLLPQVPAPESISLLSGISVLCLCCISVFSYWLYNFGVARLSAGKAAAWNNLIPVFTVILGFSLLDESFTRPQYLALLPIICGVVLSQSKDK